MEATYSSETSVDFQRTARRYIPEDRTLIYLLYSDIVHGRFSFNSDTELDLILRNVEMAVCVETEGAEQCEILICEYLQIGWNVIKLTG
jgi:hypothetical protein